MVKTLAIALVMSWGLAGLALADDRIPCRERHARAALALAATEPPRLTYTAAYQLAIASERPLVVFVDCQPVLMPELRQKAIVVATNELTGYERGTVLVGYPQGRTLYIHARLREPQAQAALVEAVEAAQRQITATTANRPPPCPGPHCVPPP
ncbi:MAG: hypothetical protein RMJ56_06720 [Gemmataceae bacterium]|nr:hypothetical protein [Gemmata sp.]MDW8197282.1 hypothetical protein [Gemmataceae bacterium]